MTAETIAFLVLATAVGVLVGWLLGHRGKHEADLRAAQLEASLQAAGDVAAERERALDQAMQRLRTGFERGLGRFAAREYLCDPVPPLGGQIFRPQGGHGA